MNTISGVIVDFLYEDFRDEDDFAEVMEYYRGMYWNFDNVIPQPRYFCPTESKNNWQEICASLDYCAIRYCFEEYSEEYTDFNFSNHKEKIEKGIGAMDIRYWMIIPVEALPL